MPVRLYIGPSGSGKTYELVKNLIIPALMAGRRVITNIAGIEYDLLKDYCSRKFNDFDVEKFGKIQLVDTDEVSHPLFFRHEHDEKNGINSYIQPGDLVCIDEIWRYFDDTKALPDRFLNFLKMHRHHVNEATGFVIDVCLISQGIEDFHRKIKSNSQETYDILKNTSVSSDNSYSIVIYGPRGRMTRANRITELSPLFYDPEVCALYKSQSLGRSRAGIKEQRADKRGSIFNNSFFKYGLPAAALFGIWSMYFLYTWYQGKMHPQQNQTASNKLPVGSPVSQINQQQQANSSPDLPKQINMIKDPVTWFVTGFYKLNNDYTFIVTNGNQSLYLTNPPFQKVGNNYVVTLPDGSFANTFNVQVSKNEKSSSLLSSAAQ